MSDPFFIKESPEVMEKILKDRLKDLKAINQELVLEKENSLKLNVQVMENLKKLSHLKFALDETSLVTITDRDGTITDVNSKFCKVSQYSRDELIGKNHRILKSGYHDQKFFENLWKTISSGKVWKGDIKNKAKDGSFYWAWTTIIPFLGDDGTPKEYIAIRTDITFLKKNEEDLIDTISDLKKSKLLKDEFVSMITHELKTPLTPIKGYCEMLKDFNFGTLTKEQIHYVEKIHSSAVILERLISDLLDVQKIDMGKMSFKIKSFDVGNFLDELQQDYSHLMKNRGIEFVVINSVKTTLKTDQFRLRQILENMIRNSVDFVPPKTGKIEVGVKQENGKMIFHVKDNGIGIQKEKQQNIFKKFYQADTSHTRKHGGTGLGLAICKGIVDGLGGKIWFESEPRKGTTFSFVIPLRNN